LSVDEAQETFKEAETPSTAGRLLREVLGRLDSLQKVGLGYISLDRSSPSLSRGESQRVRLAVSLTSRLEDILHVLDEPTIGQHPADVQRLIPAFRELAGPVAYVEHDRIAAAAADRVIDLGPGAGVDGGEVVFTGTPAELWGAETHTGRYFSLRDRVHIPAPRARPVRFLTVRGAHEHNLKGVDVPIPIGRLTVVTGVSGSGKSTLVENVLVASLREGEPTGCKALEGPQLKPVLVDQSPIGRNPRSNPATYTKLSDVVRDFYASETGLSASHFSFNRPEGACPSCKGIGAVEIKMRYLPSTWIPCSDCEGQRFSDEVLDAKASFGDRALSIADFYGLTIAEAATLLLEEAKLPPNKRRAAQRILRAMLDIGLGYLTLGQPSPTLSGGEAQRVKLAKYLGRRSLTRQLLVLDEPSTGLHPRDIDGLLKVLDRLVRAGATIVVVEHNTDVIRAADWIVDLGPGAGPEGGELIYAGPPDGLLETPESVTGIALRDEDEISPRSFEDVERYEPSTTISIRGASVHNLKDVDVDFPKGRLTVVTGVSGSGKSSLVADVLEAEARRRFLETLSLYERQGTKEGPAAVVESVTGLGVTVAVTPEGRLTGRSHQNRLYSRRSTVGTATEIWHHLAVLFASLGERECTECGAEMGRGDEWICPSCGACAPFARPRHFSPSNYAAACTTCHGVGTLQRPNPGKLIIHPERPICGGAMHSPGFFPKGYLCKPGNGGYDVIQALAARHGFDPATTPWNEMPPEAQDEFLFGDPEPLKVTFRSPRGRTHTRVLTFNGFYGWVRDWDVGGTYTDAIECPDCRGARLRPEYLAVRLVGRNIHELNTMSLTELAGGMEEVLSPDTDHFAGSSLEIIRRRLRFLIQVGLGYVHLDRVSATLSAGEAQRVRLAGLLGSGLTNLTVLLDEPTRGLHPSEVDALLGALAEMRDAGNTVIVVEHDLQVIGAADHIVDMGPGAGPTGGMIVAQGTIGKVASEDTTTAEWVRGDRRFNMDTTRREPQGWMIINSATANNLKGGEVRLPLGVLLGVCGVSGSGKSTLLIDTIGRALAPVRHTTSVAREPLEPGEHESIEGAPRRTVVVDQSRTGIRSPLSYLNLRDHLVSAYADSEDAKALGFDAKTLGGRCTACRGRGSTRLEMGFLPDVVIPCETCGGTGLTPEARGVRIRGVALPEVFSLTIDEVYDLFPEDETLRRVLGTARDVGLGYLVMRQPGFTLSGGEAQRLKIAKELCRRNNGGTLYILDEPTVGQHMEDVSRLIGVLHRLVEGGNSVVVAEHHPHLLASCDWLVELGPVGGPDGGLVVASGKAEEIASGKTPSSLYIREALEGAE
jgi:excinuclease ABC subunit A